MSIKAALEHRTTYEFERPVSLGPHVVRLRPAPHSRTPIEAYSLTVSPGSHFINWQQDPFGSWLARLVFAEKVTTLDITVGLVADLMVVNPFDFFIEDYAEAQPFTYEALLAADLAPYLRPVGDGAAGNAGGPGPVVTAFRAGLPGLPDSGVAMVPFLVQLNAAVHREVAYSVRMEAGVQSPDETLSQGIATYHVVHPGGRAHEHPPINAREAEARRSSRFEPFGHAPGAIDVAAMREAGRRAASGEYPHTLDLRRTRQTRTVSAGRADESDPHGPDPDGPDPDGPGQ